MQLDLSRVGLALALCGDDGQLQACSPSARVLLRELDAVTEPLPMRLPPPLWSAVSSAVGGQVVLPKTSPRARGHVAVQCERYDQTSCLVQLHNLVVDQDDLRARLQQHRLQALGRLTAEAVHDMRSPLASIVFAATVLAEQRGEIDSDDLKQRMRQILAAAARQHGTLTQLLEFAWPAAWTATEVDLGVALARVAATLNTALRHGGHRLETIVGPGAHRLHGSATVLEQILVTLILNAVESAPRALHIQVRTSPATQRDLIDIEVMTDGDGLPAQVRRNMFDPSVAAQPESAAAGLRTARDAAAAQGGRLYLADAPQGTTFVLSLPRRANTAVFVERDPVA